jgi:hypothetical protein
MTKEKIPEPYLKLQIEQSTPAKPKLHAVHGIWPLIEGRTSGQNSSHQKNLKAQFMEQSTTALYTLITDKIVDNRNNDAALHEEFNNAMFLIFFKQRRIRDEKK